ncbi:hypothetical protein BGZ47_000844, partial [Haplosporangium gracile]
MDSLTITAYLEVKLDAERVVDLLSAKRKIIDSEAEHQANEKSQRARAGRKAQPVALEETPIPDFLSELSSESLALSPAPSSSSTPPPSKRGRGRSSILSLVSVSEAKLFVDPASFAIHKYVLNGHNVGQIFHQYQVAVTKTVNNPTIPVSYQNISHFMAMNYILNTTEELEGFPTNALKDIRGRFAWNASRLDNLLVLKLPLGFDQFDNGLEDTYCHQVIDALFAYQFPQRSRKYSINWPSGEAHGSKNRRGFGYRPNAVVLRNGKQIGFLEVKPPGNSHTAKEYLHDHWNLTNFCKDAIDNFLQQGLPITQLFKRRLSLQTMEYMNGVYHWSLSCVSYISRDQQGSGVASCIRLLNTLE